MTTTLSCLLRQTCTGDHPMFLVRGGCTLAIVGVHELVRWILSALALCIPIAVGISYSRLVRPRGVCSGFKTSDIDVRAWY